MDGMSLRIALTGIAHILVPGALLPISPSVAPATMAHEVHRDQTAGHGKPDPIVLNELHATPTSSHHLENFIAVAEIWF